MADIDIIKGSQELAEKLKGVENLPDGVLDIVKGMQTSSEKVIDSLKRASSESEARKNEIKSLAETINELKKKSNPDGSGGGDENLNADIEKIIQKTLEEANKNFKEEFGSLKSEFDTYKQQAEAGDKDSLVKLVNDFSGHDKFKNIQDRLNIKIGDDTDVNKVVGEMDHQQILKDIQTIGDYSKAGLFEEKEARHTDQFGNTETFNDDIMSKVANAKSVIELDEALGRGSSTANAAMVEGG